MIVLTFRQLVIAFTLIMTVGSHAMEDSEVAYLGNSSRSGGGFIAAETERAIENALKSAKDSGDIQLTIEHLVLALLDEGAVRDLLENSSVDLVAVRSALKAHIDLNVPKSKEFEEPRPGSKLSIVMQRAVMKMMATNRKAINGADYIIAVLAQNDSFASQTLRDHGLALQIAEDENLERYLKKNAEQTKEIERLQEKIRVQRESQDVTSELSAAGNNIAIGAVSSSGSGDDKVVEGHRDYTLQVFSEDESGLVQFKCAISHDGRLDLYIEETPFEVKFIATKVVVLVDALSANTRLNVQLRTEIEGEQRTVSGFGGTSGAIFKDPRSLMSQRSGRL